MSNDETRISKQMLKMASREFDVESIYSVKLCDLNIVELGCIGLCSSLERLDLSRNNLSKLSLLSSLSNLSHLNLSSNRLSNLDGLHALNNLVDLNISGNLIASTDALRVCCGLEKLSELRMKDNVRNLTNPACLNNDYKNRVLSLLPKLIILDGERLTGKGSDLFKSFAEMDKTIEAIELKSDGVCSTDYKPGAWFTHDDLCLSLQETNVSAAADNGITRAQNKFNGYLLTCLFIIVNFC